MTPPMRGTPEWFQLIGELRSNPFNQHYIDHMKRSHFTDDLINERLWEQYERDGYIAPPIEAPEEDHLIHWPSENHSDLWRYLVQDVTTINNLAMCYHLFRDGDIFPHIIEFRARTKFTIQRSTSVESTSVVSEVSDLEGLRTLIEWAIHLAMVLASGKFDVTGDLEALLPIETVSPFLVAEVEVAQGWLERHSFRPNYLEIVSDLVDFDPERFY